MYRRYGLIASPVRVGPIWEASRAQKGTFQARRENMLAAKPRARFCAAVGCNDKHPLFVVLVGPGPCLLVVIFVRRGHRGHASHLKLAPPWDESSYFMHFHVSLLLTVTVGHKARSRSAFPSPHSDSGAQFLFHTLSLFPSSLSCFMHFHVFLLHWFEAPVWALGVGFALPVYGGP